MLPKATPMTLDKALAHKSMPTRGMRVPTNIQVFDRAGYYAGKVPAKVMLLERFNEGQGIYTNQFYCAFSALWVGCGVRVIVDVVFGGTGDAPNEWVILDAFVDTGKHNQEVMD